MKTGKVYLVGAGAGKPDLITVRGQDIIKEAEVIVYDYLVNPKILAKARRSTELINCNDLVSAKKSRSPHIRQLAINNLLVAKAKQGRKVLRLKGGDPTVFGRCSEEVRALASQKIEFEIVPGVSAASAAAAFGGIPLTDNRFASSCLVISGHKGSKRGGANFNWKSLAMVDTLVLYMAVGNLTNIIKKIISSGRGEDTPVAIVKDASLITQKVITGTLKDIRTKAKQNKLKAPAIIIVGKVVEVEKRCNWLKNNKRILFTGLSKERFFLKGTYFHLPLIKIVPLKSYKRFDNYLKNIDKFDWIVFTSRFGVKYFFQRVRAVSLDSRILFGIKIAAIGSATKSKLFEYGILPDLVPGKESAKGLIEEFKKLNIKNEKIFLPRSDIADKGLSKKLTTLGASVSSSYAYRNIMPKDLPDLDLSRFDEIMFTSPSTVRNFKKRYKRVPKGVKISWIGNVTLKEVRRCRLLG